MFDDKDRREIGRALMFFSQIAVNIVGCVLVGVLLGRFLDNLLGTAPWLLLLLSLLGAGAAVKSIVDLAKKQ